MVIYDLLPFIRLFNNWFSKEMRTGLALCMLVICLQKVHWVCIHFNVQNGIPHILFHRMKNWIISMYIEHKVFFGCDIKGSRHAILRLKATGTKKNLLEILPNRRRRVKQKKNTFSPYFLILTNLCRLPDIITCLHDNRHVFAPLFYFPLFFIKWQEPCTVCMHCTLKVITIIIIIIITIYKRLI